MPRRFTSFYRRRSYQSRVTDQAETACQARSSTRLVAAAAQVPPSAIKQFYNREPAYRSPVCPFPDYSSSNASNHCQTSSSEKERRRETPPVGSRELDRIDDRRCFSGHAPCKILSLATCLIPILVLERASGRAQFEVRMAQITGIGVRSRTYVLLMYQSLLRAQTSPCQVENHHSFGSTTWTGSLMARLDLDSDSALWVTHI